MYIEIQKIHRYNKHFNLLIHPSVIIIRVTLLALLLFLSLYARYNFSRVYLLQVQ